jgi:nucleoside phosphorylase
MENSIDVCLVCALPEEARALLEVIQPHCEKPIEERVSSRHHYSFRFATIKNSRDESLNLHISWLPRYGPQEMTLHLSRVLDDCQPRIAIMTGICAGDAQRVQLGDLIVAERTFTFDNGKFAADEYGRSIHELDAMTYQLDAGILQFLGLFDDWKPLVARLDRPHSQPGINLNDHQIRCFIRAMASSNAVRADNPFEDVRAPVRGTVAIDMEGAAFGQVMSHYPLIRWLVVKGVCDFADQTKNDAYHDFAARASATYALSFIRAFVSDERLPRPDRILQSNQVEPFGVQDSHQSARFGRPFPEVWNVSRRHNAFFTGRDHLLQELFAGFAFENAGGMTVSQAITGLGGMGKTQTAAEYAYRYREHYRTVLWVNAETQEDILMRFQAIASTLKLPRDKVQNSTSLIQIMHEWFITETQWLLICDNADDLSLVDRFLPKAARGHILLTTRAGALNAQAQPVILEPLTPQAGALCILRRAGILAWQGQLTDARETDVDLAQKLSELMDGLPLALEQAGAYINDTACGVRRYLHLYKEFRKDIQRVHHGASPDYPESVASVWRLSRDIIKQSNAAASELLQLCAFLAPEAIPDELLMKGASALGPILGPVAARPVDLDLTIATLRKYSLLNREADRETDLTRLSIHRIMQEILQDEMDEPTQRVWAERSVTAVARALPFIDWQIMQAHARKCLSLIEKWKMTSPEAEFIRKRLADANDTNSGWSVEERQSEGLKSRSRLARILQVFGRKQPDVNDR